MASKAPRKLEAVKVVQAPIEHDTTRQNHPRNHQENREIDIPYSPAHPLHRRSDPSVATPDKVAQLGARVAMNNVSNTAISTTASTSNPSRTQAMAEARQREARKAIRPGTVVDKYRFDGLIGAGGFSLVYSAFDLADNKPVIIKEYFPKHAARRVNETLIRPSKDLKQVKHFHAGLKQFFAEARILVAINHPHVVKTLNVFRANNSAYIVSEGCTGRDLKWFLKTTREPLSHELLIQIFMPILSGLRSMHQAGFVHLDIKPANILLRAKRGAQLLDFGAAQPIHSADRVNNMQTLTHGFAPPEQYDKKAALGPWSDIYATAATIFFCMSYKMPKKSKGGKMRSQLNVEKYSQHYPASLVKAINHALSLDVENRYADIDNFAAELLSGSEWRSLQDYEQSVLNIDRKQLHNEPTDSMIYGRKDDVA